MGTKKNCLSYYNAISRYLQETDITYARTRGLAIKQSEFLTRKLFYATRR